MTNTEKEFLQDLLKGIEFIEPIFDFGTLQSDLKTKKYSELEKQIDKKVIINLSNIEVPIYTVKYEGLNHKKTLVQQLLKFDGDDITYNPNIINGFLTKSDEK